MKERFLTWLKNTAVILIASLMLLGVIPLGMISLHSTANAEGDFVRLYPEAELSLSPKEGQLEQDLVAEEETTYGIGKDHYGYLRFDLREYTGKKAKKLNKVTLRMTFLEMYAGRNISVQVWLMPEERWSKSMEWDEKPSRVGEVLVATSNLVSERRDDPQLLEVDLTDYVRQYAEAGKEKISFRIDSSEDGMSAVYAGASHEDPTYRPCLKVVTGNGKDPDEKDLTKVLLKEKYATDQQEDTIVRVGGKREIYLKFSLNPNNIKGGIYRAILKMDCRNREEGALLRVDRLEDTKWNKKSLKEKGVQGKRHMIYREEDAGAWGYEEIDLTEAVNHALANGEKEIAFAVYSEHGEIAFGFERETQPEMELFVSDNRSVVAMTEAATKLLGENSGREEITSALLHNYVAENGVRTSAVWSAQDKETGEDAKDTLSRNGKVVAPEWFREDKELVVKATVSSGKHQMNLLYYLTVPTEEPPEFEEEITGTMVDMGTRTSERKGHVELVGTTAHSRRVEGQKMTYREMGRDEMIILHLSVDPKKQNYLTVKLWEEDDFPGISVTNLRDEGRKNFEIRQTDIAVKEEGGFCYLTYPIPMSYTKGREYVSLRLTMVEPEEEISAVVTEEQETEEPETEQPEQVISVYGAYVTQMAYFDPMAFAEQGEPVIKKEESEESAAYQFLKKIYGAAFQDEDSQEEENPEEAVAPTEERKGVFTEMNNRKQTTLVFGKEENLMMTLSEKETKAKIYRDTPYYNAYAEKETRTYPENNLLAVQYGAYRIFRNGGETDLPIPWQEEAMEGLYRNLADETYYSFLQKGNKLDDSALVEGTEITTGDQAVIRPGETVAFVKVAEPLRYADIRVSEINGQTLADLILKDPLEITAMTFRVMGAVPEEEEKTMILCAVYERGMLVGIKRQFLTISQGQVAAEILLDEALSLMPGQTLKVFVKNCDEEYKSMTPVLELPQKQSVEE